VDVLLPNVFELWLDDHGTVGADHTPFSIDLHKGIAVLAE